MNKNIFILVLVIVGVAAGFLGGYFLREIKIKSSASSIVDPIRASSDSDDFVEMLGSPDGANIVDSFKETISTESNNIFRTLILLQYSGSYLWHNYQVFDTHAKRFVAKDLFQTACDGGCNNNTEPIFIIKDNLLLVQRTLSDDGIYGNGPSEIWFADFTGKLLKKALDYNTTNQEVIKTEWRDVMLITYSDTDHKHKTNEVRYSIDTEKLILELSK